ncbi:G-D-S-L family lipolytic protein [Maribacter sp. PR1]|uniref:G-D-S-L family lipolytic protein n=1 Tax=Maribacter cobaltidurans TaxID=1178778 RepID=A0ABU7ISK4_9FLAO|nr:MULTISPECIES: G-D-S-L family lipolytic protein [Maribacter]MDC6388123.1 G-D-S-L family lipolytic protein [Maribacter sp. PR1]MEE1975511.1 G-D-S-L family lipolytic protein [Maribacter cobaltidurans]
MKKIKYIVLSSLVLGFVACNDPEDVLLEEPIVVEDLPELTAGSADFSNYVSLGNSLTAGFTDGALFQAGQTYSLPNILSQKFTLVGGGDFTQPLTSDNLGGLAAAGDRIQGPRLVFGGAGPVPLESVIGPVTVGTDIVLNNPTGPFNNLGVPGAKSFHLLAPGYGNLGNVSLGLANPYFVRMTGSTPEISVLEMAVSQSPSFFSLWIGNNDVLGYATTGGDGTNPITPVSGAPGVGFDGSYGALVATLTAGGAQGVVANIPNVTSIPHFTTVPHNPLDPTNPDFGPQIATLNGIFGQLNQVYVFLGVPERSIEFSTTAASEVVIRDETLTDLSAQITGVLSASPTFPAFVQSFGLPAQAAPLVATLLGNTYGQTREATADDLFVLPSSSIIGTVNVESVGALMNAGLPEELAGQFSVEGISLPLEDKWVLIPSEQEEIAVATEAFNQIIATVASQAGLALVDANTLLDQLANGGITSGDFTLTANLVTGSAFSLDGIHPTARGYALLANEFMKAIDATYGSNFEASGNLVNVGNYPTNFSPTLQ